MTNQDNIKVIDNPIAGYLPTERTIQAAYELGYSYGKEGRDQFNKSNSIFLNEVYKDAWVRGKEDGENGREMKGRVRYE